MHHGPGPLCGRRRLVAVARATSQPDPPASASRVVVTLHIDGEIEPVMAEYIDPAFRGHRRYGTRDSHGAASPIAEIDGYPVTIDETVKRKSK